jgi:hypothetical protein
MEPGDIEVEVTYFHLALVNLWKADMVLNGHAGNQERVSMTLILVGGAWPNICESDR